jgi:hypothetical protein
MIGADRGSVPPWVLEPHKLWSLFDMLRFHAYPFIATLSDLGRAIRALDDHLQKGNPPVSMVGIAISYLERDLPNLPISAGVLAQYRRLREKVEDRHTSADALRTLLYDFEAALHEDLKQHFFFLIPASQRLLYQSPMPFGEPVYMKFALAREDVKGACRCMVLDEWSAAVFHLMRVAEHGLRTVARGLGIRNVEVKDWETALRDMDHALKVLGGTRRTVTRDRKLQYYGEARGDLAGFKHAWRNHVMHTRKNYTPEEAWPVFYAVRSFMEHLATSPAATAQRG